MSLNRSEKQASVEEISALAAKAQSLVLAEYRGIAVEQMTKLRKQARENGVHLRVFKNTLARRAVKGTPYESIAADMTGPLIYGFSEDAVAAARVIHDFAKTNDKLVIRSGMVNGKPLNPAGVKDLASIPPRDVLLARLLGVMKAPVSGFAVALGQLAKKREEQAAA
ncbi:MAG: 50S ribosomal protein L10 [Thiomonas sp.]